MIEFIDDPQNGHPDLIVCAGIIRIGRINANGRNNFSLIMSAELKNGKLACRSGNFETLDQAKAEAQCIIREALG